MMEEVYKLLKQYGTYYLATVDGDSPKVRPFGTIDLFEGKLYIQTGKVKPVYAQLKKNPNVELCACRDGQWIRVSGKLAEHDSREARKHMLDEYPELRSMYSEDDGNSTVFFFESGRAEICALGQPSKVIEF